MVLDAFGGAREVGHPGTSVTVRALGRKEDQERVAPLVVQGQDVAGPDLDHVDEPRMRESRGSLRISGTDDYRALRQAPPPHDAAGPVVTGLKHDFSPGFHLPQRATQVGVRPQL